MKKIISISILIILVGMLLCSCSHKIYTDSNKKMLQNKFVVIHKDESLTEENIYLVYDKETKIVYLYTRGSLTPYYIVVDGEPTIAIYGVNYEYQE